MSDTMTNSPSGQPGEQKEVSEKKRKRYQGYDVDKMRNKRAGRHKPWFWKVLGISLILTILLILAAFGYIFRSNKKMMAYLSQINEANTVEKLLDGHKNITITTSYSHLSEGDDYKTTRFLKKDKDGEYYSYLKTEGLEKDYKEVIADGEMYRYDERFAYCFGLLGEEDQNQCLEEIKDAVFQASEEEKIDNQKESGHFIKVEALYEVSEGDDYNTTYDFQAGEQVVQTLTLDKETLIVLTAVETCGGEEFYSYTVEFDGENKIPQFYKDVKDLTKDRLCTVYYDYEGKNEKKYTFKLSSDVYFNLLPHKGYKAYTDEDCEKEFTDYQVEVQNPETDLTLYVKKESE